MIGHIPDNPETHASGCEKASNENSFSLCEIDATRDHSPQFFERDKSAIFRPFGQQIRCASGKHSQPSFTGKAPPASNSSRLRLTSGNMESINLTSSRHAS